MQEVISSNLDIFTPRPHLLSVGDHKYEQVFTKTTLDPSVTSLEFSAPSDNLLYTDIKNSFLWLRVKITKGDGSNVDNDPVIGPVQNLLGSMFKNCQLFLNDVKISGNEDSMPYISWLNLFMQPYGAKTTWMTNNLWYEDDYSSLTKANQANPNAGAEARNSGLTQRTKWFANSREVTLIGQLFTPVHLCEKYILPNCKLDWKMDMQPISFFLMSNDANAASFKFLITFAAILLKRVAVSPSVSMAHAQMLQTRNAIYTCRYMLSRSYVIPRGSFDFKFPNAFVGKDMPVAIFMVFLLPQAKAGSYAQNPFLFQNAGLISIDCLMGTRRVPAIGCDLDHDNFNTQQAYWETLKALDAIGSSNGPDNFKRDHFSTGLAIIGFDLSRDANTSAFYDNTSFDASNITITGKFAAATPSVYNLLVLGVFNGQLEINKYYSPLVSWA